jgi:NitT/TauT family transport system permease protein
MRRFAISSLFFIVVLTLIEIAARRQLWAEEYLPAPSSVLKYLYSATIDGTLLNAVYVTLKRLGQGYLTGVCLGIPLGLLNARFQFFEDTIGVVALGLQALPSICWVPLALLWFGQTETAMFFIVVMGSVWSIVLATAAGVKHVPPIYIRAAQTMGSHGLHTLIRVVIPASLPYIISGMKQGWAFAWRSLMAAEIYVTILTGFGLGYLLHYARELHSMDAVIGIMVVIIIVGLVIDKCFFSPLENFLQKRWGTTLKK